MRPDDVHTHSLDEQIDLLKPARPNVLEDPILETALRNLKKREQDDERKQQIGSKAPKSGPVMHRVFPALFGGEQRQSCLQQLIHGNL